MYDIKILYEAFTLKEAINLRAQHPEALILAGGSDILIKMREGKLAGAELISIYGVDELRGVSLDADGTLRILPLTSFSHITKHPLINKLIPVLGEAVDKVGGPQIRNLSRFRIHPFRMGRGGGANGRKRKARAAHIRILPRRRQDGCA